MSNSETLAQKIAKLLEAEQAPADISAVLARLDNIDARLDRLESNISPTQQAEISRLPFHPSTDRFAIAEAIADEIFGNTQKEKTCSFEPNGRPCDHCSMCSSRGF